MTARRLCMHKVCVVVLNSSLNQRHSQVKVSTGKIRGEKVVSCLIWLDSVIKKKSFVSFMAIIPTAHNKGSGPAGVVMRSESTPNPVKILSS